MQFKVMEYRPAGQMTVADRALMQKVTSGGVRVLMRKSGLSQHTIEAIRQGLPVRQRTLERLIAAISGRAAECHG